MEQVGELIEQPYLHPEDFLLVFGWLRKTLLNYHMHVYSHEQHCSEHLNRDPEELATIDAFDVLIVLADKRPAVLFAGHGDPRVQDQKQVDEMQDHLKALKEELEAMICTKLNYQFKFLLKTCGFYLYHEDLQHVVTFIQQRNSGRKLTDILGYLAPYEPDRWICHAYFTFNGLRFLSFGMQCVRDNDIQELQRRLVQYKSVAAKLDGKVTMGIEFF